MLRDTTHSLLNWFLDVRSNVLDIEGEHRAPELSKHIASCYQHIEINSVDGDMNVKRINPININAFLQNDVEYLRPIEKLYELVNGHLKSYLSYFFVIGSMATMDYKKGWSDLDTFMVVKDSVVKDPEQLHRLRQIAFDAWSNIFLKITPLQHHGFIVITESDLDDYTSKFMPPAVFDSALSLLDGSEEYIKFNTSFEDRTSIVTGLNSRINVYEDAIKTGVFKHHPKDGKYLKAHFMDSDDSMYQLFCFLGYIMMIPSLYMTGIGESCYKRDSFKLAKCAFSHSSWSLIEKASYIRSEWEKLEGTNYTGNAVPKWLMEILGENYIEESLNLVKEAVYNIDCHNK